VMESLVDREVTLSDPDEDSYSLSQTRSERINTESQAISALPGYIEAELNKIGASNNVGTTAPKRRGIRSLFSRILSN